MLTETGARNYRHLSAVYCGKAAGFQYVHGLLDRIMALLRQPWHNEHGYFLKQCEGKMFHIAIYLMTACSFSGRR